MKHLLILSLLFAAGPTLHAQTYPPTGTECYPGSGCKGGGTSNPPTEEPARKVIGTTYQPTDFTKAFLPAGGNDLSSLCSLAFAKVTGGYQGKQPLVIFPANQLGVAAGGPYDFFFPSSQFPRFMGVQPVVSTTLWGNGPPPYDWQGITKGFNNPNMSPFEPALYEQNPNGTQTQFSEQFIKLGAVPSPTSCILTQGAATPAHWFFDERPYVGNYGLAVIGIQTCPNGQQVNGSTGNCVAKNKPTTSAVTSFCTGKSAATNACVDTAGAITSLLPGINGPCTSNFTQQPMPIACQLVNGIPGSTSTTTGGGGGVLITWDPPGLSGGGTGCIAGDIGCPCLDSSFAPIPCQNTAAGIDPKTGKKFTGTTTPVEMPAAPVGALDQEGIYQAGSNDWISLTGWAATGAGLIPNGVTIASPLYLFRDPWCPTPSTCEQGIKQVATAWGTEEATGPVRKDVQAFLTNWPDVKFFQFDNLATLLPTGYIGNLEVHAQDVTGRYGLVGRTFYAQGRQYTNPPVQIGAAQTQITDGGSNSIITIPVHGVVGGGGNLINDVVFSFQPTAPGGGPSSVGTCYGQLVPGSSNGTFTPNGTVFIINDNGMGWKQSAAANTPININNSQCTITYASWTNIGAGQDAVLSLTMQWPAKYYGKNLLVYAWASDSAGNQSGWNPVGNVTVGSFAGPGPYVASIYSGGMGLTGMVPVSDNLNPPTLQPINFTVNALDNTGIAQQLFVWINYFPGQAATGCNLSYLPNSNQVWLTGDSGTTNLVGTLGTGSLSNSQCTVDLTHSAGGLNQSDIVFSPSITFNPNWTGPANAPQQSHKTVYTYVVDSNGSGGQGWQPQGVLVIP